MAPPVSEVAIETIDTASSPSITADSGKRPVCSASSKERGAVVRSFAGQHTSSQRLPHKGAHQGL
jgi:hypothetical protein